MFAYIVRRILATIPVMAVVALFVFALLHLSPGDPAAIIAGDTATADDIARIRQKLGLADGTRLAHYATRWVLENDQAAG